MADLVIGIGAQKAGTTTMARELANHPDFAFSLIKELHYFNAKHMPNFHSYDRKFRRTLDEQLGAIRHRRKVRDKRRTRLEALRLRVALGEGEITYRERFASEFDLDTVKCFGEITPAYALLPVEGYRDMRASADRVRIVFVMRDPMDRLISHARFEAGRGKKSRAFMETKFFENPVVIARSRYDTTIERVEEVFDPADIHLAFFEDLVAGPDAFFRRLYDWMGLPHRPPEEERHERKSGTTDLVIPEEAMLAALRPTYAFMADRFGDALPARWKARLAQLG